MIPNTWNTITAMIIIRFFCRPLISGALVTTGYLMNSVGDVGQDVLWHYELRETQCHRINRQAQADGQSNTQ
jgi:hypothetical protein